MAVSQDFNDTPTTREATTDVIGAKGVELDVSDAGADQSAETPAGVVVAAAGDSLKADLTVLDLEDLLGLRLNDENEPDRAANSPAGLETVLANADLPADLTDLDLEQVLGLELSGEALPTVLEVAELPVDLTGLELAQLLGLNLAGDTLPTIQEVVQLALQSFNEGDSDSDEADTVNADADNQDDDTVEANNTDDGNADADADGVEVLASNVPSASDDDLSFIDDQSLTEQAEATTDADGSETGDGDGTGDSADADPELAGDAAEDVLASSEDDSSPAPEPTPEPEPEPEPAPAGGGANNAPTAVNDAPTTAEDTAVIVSVLSNDSDPENDPLTITAVTQGANGSVVNNGDGTVTYTANADYNGADSFTYTIDDGNGGTDTATVNVTVTAVNDGPIAVNDAPATTANTAVIVSVLTNDSDPEGDTLTITGITQGTNGTVVNNGDGTVTYTPNASYVGADSFTYTIDDGNGGTDTATVNVTVSGSVLNGTLATIH
ncbi:MAG: tandem-95 repeat protein [Alphaproteobacteria bacterium]|nr:tandem-95 repeat protein [Alphaproteobacteria bacterium]